MMNKKANNVMINSPSYGRHFDQWHAACPVPWQAYTQHGFVAGLGDGSLPLTCFLHYLRRDYIFLLHFLRTWALAIVKAGNLEEMKEASITVHTLIHDEKQLHVSICAAEGISKDELYNTREALQNIAYPRYVLEGDFLDLMIALASCVMHCGKIDVWRAASKPACDYGDWFRTATKLEVDFWQMGLNR